MSHPARSSFVVAALALCAWGGGHAQAEESTAGRFLVATEEMGDPRFSETVIYMCRHTEMGAMGLVVNRPVASMSGDELLSGFGLPPSDDRPPAADVTIHYGGPVEGNRVFVLHSPDYEAEDSCGLGNGIVMSSEPSLLEDIAAGEGPERSLLVLGYSGWAPGQLDAELAAGAWTTAPLDEALLFDPDPRDKWRRALTLEGIDI